VSKSTNSRQHSRHSASPRTGFFERFASRVTSIAGSTGAFIAAVLVVLVWLVTGPLFDYSETWQLIINTGTTIVTFLMVFLIQKTQNKESLAIQLKLNELVAAHHYASNRLVNVEGMTEEELHTIQKYYMKLSDLSKTSKNLQESHSIEEAEQRDEYKKEFGSMKKKHRSRSRSRNKNNGKSNGNTTGKRPD
jgi:low affinity Fe/Cu permease